MDSDGQWWTVMDSDGQQFHQFKQSKKSTLTSNH